MKPILFTQHARDSIRERGLDPAWIEATARHPDWTTPDPDDPEVERRFSVISEAGGRVLRAP